MFPNWSKLEGRKPESQGTGTWALHGEMKELDLFSGRSGQQWPCCSCEATKKREMGSTGGSQSRVTNHQCKLVQEVLNRNEVSKINLGTNKHWTGCSRSWGILLFFKIQLHKAQSQFNTDTWIR